MFSYVCNMKKVCALYTSMASVRVRLFLDCRPSTRNSHTRCDSNTPHAAFNSSLCCARIRSCSRPKDVGR